MAKITVIIDSVDTISDEFYIENDGATASQVLGAMSILARYLTDNTNITIKDVIKIIESSTGMAD